MKIDVVTSYMVTGFDGVVLDLAIVDVDVDVVFVNVDIDVGIDYDLYMFSLLFHLETCAPAVAFAATDADLVYFWSEEVIL